jgi:hypothetical protein
MACMVLRHCRGDVLFRNYYDQFCSQNQPLMLFQHIFCFFERKLDLFGFVGKLLTVYNITRSCLKISSSSWETDKKSSQGALKLEVPKMPKMS